jgi:hypothetical protein
VDVDQAACAESFVNELVENTAGPVGLVVTEDFKITGFRNAIFIYDVTIRVTEESAP